ncbi:hypothetical protein JYT72_01425 [Crocinitomix catalasitica]|nr:hypothetical protein [Crocinitomix catalasitica]
MRNKRILTVWMITIAAATGFCQDDQNSWDYLVGVWQIEDQEQFEKWEKSADNQLLGSSYKMVGGEKVLLETLLIENIDGMIIYEAKVLGQNDGEGIRFTLNAKEEGCLSFENLDHDFPKKIRYKKVNEETVFVEVLGEGDQGFSYSMFKIIE